MDQTIKAVNALTTFSPILRLIALSTCIFLSACETNLGTEDLRIVNNLPTSMTYYVPVDAPIELAGGEGGYSVRYIQNPEPGMTEDEIDGAEGNNPIDLEIIKESGAKNRFRLVGLPLPGGVELETSTDYWIEISDGSTTKRIKSELEVSVPVLDVSSFASLTVTESRSALENLTGPLDRNIPLCAEAYEEFPKAKMTAYGMAYPSSLLLGFPSQLIETSVEFEYEVGVAAGSSAATPNADFIAETGSFTLEAGMLGCPITVYVLDDAEIEGTEQFEVRVTSISGAPVRPVLTALRGVVRINDDEPTINDFEGEYVVNAGESLSLSATISGVPDTEVFVPIRVGDETTAASDLYSITPVSRNLVFGPGEVEKVFSFNALLGSHSGSNDPLVVLSLGEGEASAENRVEVRMNQWVEQTTLPTFISDEYEAIAVAEDLVFAMANFVDGGEQKVRLVATDKEGAVVDFAGSSSYIIEEAGVDLIGKDIFAFDLNGVTRLIALLEVDGLFGSVAWGGKDFALVLLELQNDGSLSEIARSQHGSEADDEPLRLDGIDSGSLVLVSGDTTGQSLDGLAVFPANGLQDGFIYKIGADLSSVRWARFAGGAANDSVRSVVGNSDNVFAALSTGNSKYVNAYLADDSSFGDDDLTIPQYNIGFSRPSNIASMLDLGNNSLALLADSDQVLGSTNITPDGSNDAFVGLFDPSADGFSSVISLSTPDEDVSVGMVTVNEDGAILVAGNTQGVFEGETQFGADGESDGFLASLAVNTTLDLTNVTQFGTGGDDQVIDIEALDDEKALVLWKENDTSGNGTYRYRITPFAPDGTNLAPLN